MSVLIIFYAAVMKASKQGGRVVPCAVDLFLDLASESANLHKQDFMTPFSPCKKILRPSGTTNNQNATMDDGLAKSEALRLRTPCHPKQSPTTRR